MGHMGSMGIPGFENGLQDSIDGGTLVLYHIFGHMNCGDIPFFI
jgi:hypothetical protein